MDRWIALDPLYTLSLTSFLPLYKRKFLNTQPLLVVKHDLKLLGYSLALMCERFHHTAPFPFYSEFTTHPMHAICLVQTRFFDYSRVAQYRALWNLERVDMLVSPVRESKFCISGKVIFESTLDWPNQQHMLVIINTSVVMIWNKHMSNGWYKPSKRPKRATTSWKRSYHNWCASAEGPSEERVDFGQKWWGRPHHFAHEALYTWTWLAYRKPLKGLALLSFQ